MAQKSNRFLKQNEEINNFFLQGKRGGRITEIWIFF